MKLLPFVVKYLNGLTTIEPNYTTTLSILFTNTTLTNDSLKKPIMHHKQFIIVPSNCSLHTKPINNTFPYPPLANMASRIAAHMLEKM